MGESHHVAAGPSRQIADDRRLNVDRRLHAAILPQRDFSASKSSLLRTLRQFPLHNGERGGAAGFYQQALGVVHEEFHFGPLGPVRAGVGEDPFGGP